MTFLTSAGAAAGIANVGKYKFTPVNRTYSGMVSDQTGQNYDTLVFGDVAAGFVYRPDGSSRTMAGDDGMTSVGEGAQGNVVHIVNAAPDTVTPSGKRKENQRLQKQDRHEHRAIK